MLYPFVTLVRPKAHPFSDMADPRSSRGFLRAAPRLSLSERDLQELPVPKSGGLVAARPAQSFRSTLRDSSSITGFLSPVHAGIGQIDAQKVGEELCLDYPDHFNLSFSSLLKITNKDPCNCEVIGLIFSWAANLTCAHVSSCHLLPTSAAHFAVQ